ncbi:hypothetical protein PLICRDRAFT_114074 [Plicaturopsis crispa FD-325 SS-3]|nr:hypothetical protein PLICRDRAFT_114074 [Plicaturopsis crispa FD-325 SS-3]
MAASSPSRSTTSQATVTHIAHHDQYYYRGGDITFNVEDKLFRVHSLFFEREATNFPLHMPLPVGDPAGTSDATPYKLEGVNSADFARFLWVFYNETYSIYEAPVEDWIVILRLAQQWGFPQVKNLVVRELEKKRIGHITKIALYRENEIDASYLVPSYAALCQRDAWLKKGEAEKLGMDVVLAYGRAREAIRGRLDRGSPTAVELDADEVNKIIRREFEIPGADPSTARAAGSSTANGSVPTMSTPTPPNAAGSTRGANSGVGRGTSTGRG